MDRQDIPLTFSKYPEIITEMEYNHNYRWLAECLRFLEPKILDQSCIEEIQKYVKAESNIDDWVKWIKSF